MPNRPFIHTFIHTVIHTFSHFFWFKIPLSLLFQSRNRKKKLLKNRHKPMMFYLTDRRKISKNGR